MKTHNFIILLLLISLPCFAQLNIYKSSMTPNDDFTVRVREQGGVWQDLYEYRVDVDMDNVRQASMVEFDMGSKPVDVMVKKNNGKIYDVDIRPLSKNIDHRVEKNAILFTKIGRASCRERVSSPV